MRPEGCRCSPAYLVVSLLAAELRFIVQGGSVAVLTMPEAGLSAHVGPLSRVIENVGGSRGYVAPGHREAVG